MRLRRPVYHHGPRSVMSAVAPRAPPATQILLQIRAVPRHTFTGLVLNQLFFLAARNFNIFSFRSSSNPFCLSATSYPALAFKHKTFGDCPEKFDKTTVEYSSSLVLENESVKLPPLSCQLAEVHYKASIALCLTASRLVHSIHLVRALSRA
jgi:hypothetical protein